jgi:hypothetical protein
MARPATTLQLRPAKAEGWTRLSLSCAVPDSLPAPALYQLLSLLTFWSGRRLTVALDAAGPAGWCECLDKLVLLGERHLHLAVAEYLEHYHVERNHQGLDNQLITTTPLAATPGNDDSPVVRRERLGGLLSFYHRRAA